MLTPSAPMPTNKPALLTLFPLPPLPRRYGMRLQPQAQLRPSRFSLKILWLCIPLCKLSIPPTPSVLNEFMIDVRAIPQHHIGQGAPILVLTVGVEHDISSKDEG